MPRLPSPLAPLVLALFTACGGGPWPAETPWEPVRGRSPEALLRARPLLRPDARVRATPRLPPPPWVEPDDRRCLPFAELPARWIHRDAGAGGPALVVDGEALGTVTATRTMLWALSLETGERRLVREVTRHHHLRHHARNVLVLAADDGSALEARSRIDGRYLWRMPLLRGPETSLFGADDERLYLADPPDGEAVRLAAVAVATGALAWERDLAPGGAVDLPAVARLEGDRVLAATTHRSDAAKTVVLALDAATGETIWSAELELDADVVEVLGTGDGGVLVGLDTGDAGVMVALDADGLLRWTAPFADEATAVPWPSRPVVAAAGRVVAQDGAVLDLATGAVAHRVPALAWDHPAWPAGDRVFAVTARGAADLFAFRLADGAVTATHPLDAGGAPWRLARAAPTANGSLLAALVKEGTGTRQLCELSAEGLAHARRLPAPPAGAGAPSHLPAGGLWLETFPTGTEEVPGIELRAYDLAGFSAPASTPLPTP